MGGDQSRPAKSAQETVMDFKLNAKKMEQEANKCAALRKKFEAEALVSVKKNEMDVARIQAGRAMAQKKRSVDLRKLSAQLDAVADKLVDADRMKKLTGDLQSMTYNLSEQLQDMDLERINATLGQFDQEMKNLGMVSDLMGDKLGRVVDDSAPPDSVDVYLMQLQQEAAREVQLPPGGGIGAAAAAAPLPLQPQGPVAIGVAAGSTGGHPQGCRCAQCAQMQAHPAGCQCTACRPPFPASQFPPQPPFGGGGGGGGGGESLEERLARINKM